jgi:hypothetical protein
MAGDVSVAAGRPPGETAGTGPGLSAAQQRFWLDVAAVAAAWGRGLLACLVGAAVLQGVLSAFPALLWCGIPVTLPVSALVIALVGLRCAPQWGVVFAAFAGLLADAAGPALLGGTAWAYLPVAVCFTLLHRHVRREHTVTLILYAGAQALLQTAGTYVGLRCAGLTNTPGYVATVTIVLSVLLTGVTAGLTALAIRFTDAVKRHYGRAA